jgi:hypothetical protein
VASSDGSTSAGILVTTYYGGGTTALITYNTLTGNTGGIAVGYDGSDTSVVTAHFNTIDGNTSYGVDTTAPAVDAESNWWGDASGPSGQGPGTGDAVSTNVDFEPWLMEEDGTETTETDTGTGAGASASTTNVEATATGGAGDTTVTVGEYVDNPSGASPGFRHGPGATYIDVHVGGTLPTELVVEVDCPGGVCSGVSMQWWDGTAWQTVVVQEIDAGIVRATLNDVDSTPLISELTGTPFGVGSLSTVGWEGSSANKAAVVAPWIALLATVMAGALLVVRRRRAQI